MANKKKRTLQLLPMDKLQNRPCEVDGRPALFHRWIKEDRALLKIAAMVHPDVREAIIRRFKEDGVIDGGCHFEVVHETFALVEYRDGTIGQVKPELVRFVDGEVRSDEG